MVTPFLVSVGIDFGLKTYMKMNDGTTVPQFLKSGLRRLQRKSRNLSKCKSGSNNRERKRLDLDRHHEKAVNQRNAFQWKLAHQLCRQYDHIFIEDIQLTGMSALWGRKMADLARGEFVLKLQYVASKYGVTVNKIYRWYPSSKMCTYGYVNHGQQILERTWVCPECGTVHNRDLLAASNIPAEHCRIEECL